ncbi:uncharacterized protein G2W53_024892 [Senna tora]|uniref:Uncharacterized protein n=1 Tax=Senna tora TaxID=362788 RepID=A0A834TEB7_9FABA|nr:uncharacterized protein G2W53_024892 [Senna tora]
MEVPTQQVVNLRQISMNLGATCYVQRGSL